MAAKKKANQLVELSKIKELCVKMRKAKLVAVDTETTGLDWKTERLVGISLAMDSQQGYFFLLPPPTQRVELGRLLADPAVEKVFHNSKFDRHFLRKAGLDVKGRVWDTYPLAKLWNENRREHKLKSLAKELVDPSADEAQDALKKWMEENKKTWKDVESVPKTILSEYAAEDARLCFGLKEKLFDELLVKEKIPLALLELEMEVLDIAFEMEHKGVRIDRKFLERYSATLKKGQEAAYKAMKKIVRIDFNPESGQQVADLLHSLGWSGERATPAGQDAVDKRALEAFSHPFTKLLLEHRRLGTIRGTFVEGMLTRAVKDTVHTNYNTAGAVTLRWSSNDPNLQNVDKKSEARKGIIPRAGHDLWLFDLKQIEPVVFAAISNAPKLVEAFRQGMDYHTVNAAAAFGVPAEKVTPEQRTKAKGLGLAIMYQAGAKKAAQMMGVLEPEGRRILDDFYKRMPEIKDFQREVNKQVELRAKAAAAGTLVSEGRDWIYKGEPLPIKKIPKRDGSGFWEFTNFDAVEEYGFVRNPFGQKRRLQIKDAYKGLNAVVQSTAGLLLKFAMVRVRRELGLVPLLQVHDELGYELPRNKHAKGTAAQIKRIMESVQDTDKVFAKVPIRVDVAVAAKSWGEEKEVKL